MSNPDMVGWDLLYRLVEKNLKTDYDVLIAIIHWFLIKNAGFRCLGIGDQKSLDENEESSEFLPDHWNDNNFSSYTLRYVHNGQVYVLLGTIANDTIIVNLLNSESLEVGNCAFNIKNTVKSMKGPLKSLVPDIYAVLTRLKKELLEKIIKVEATKTAHTQTTTEETRSSFRPPLSSEPPVPFPDPLRIYPSPRIIDPVRDIGRGDLDPLGRGGGGMLFNPPGMPFNPPLPGGHPAGQFPQFVPGARFDPFGPPDPGQPGRRFRAGQDPDPDHLPPPGYDDMFM